ncbi:MAG: hypothetical protein ABJL55_18045 [Roseibium sp.]
MVSTTGNLIDEIWDTKHVGKGLGSLGLGIDVLVRSLDDDGLTFKDTSAIATGALAGWAAGFAVGGPLGAIVGGIIVGPLAAYLVDGIDALEGYPDPDLFPHNHPLAPNTINPSNAYVPYNDPNYSPYPDYPTQITDGIKELSDINVGRNFGKGISRAKDVGWHVFDDAGGLPSMSSGEALDLRDSISGAQKNVFSNPQIASGILQGYDLNGPETVVDLPQTHYSGSSDGGSSYGNPDAGGTSGSDRNTGSAQTQSQSSSGNSGGSYSSGYRRNYSYDSSSRSGDGNSGGSYDGHSSSYGNPDAGGTSSGGSVPTPRSKPGSTGSSGPVHNPSDWDNHSGNDSSAKPMLMDLDDDGFELIERTDSTVYLDIEDDGYQHRTAWVGTGDGVLIVDLEQKPLRRAKAFLALVGGLRKWTASMNASHAFVHVTTRSNL